MLGVENLPVGVIFLIFLVSLSDSCVDVSQGFFTFAPCGQFAWQHPVASKEADVESHQPGSPSNGARASSSFCPMTLILCGGAAWPIRNADRWWNSRIPS